MAKKKGKKGKKKDGNGGIEIRTTQLILQERNRMLCPRLGDKYTRTIQVGEILEVSLAGASPTIYFYLIVT